MLKVTKVWPHKYVSGKLLGFADIQLSLDGSDDGAHMVWKGLKLFQGEGRVEIALPSMKDAKGQKDENDKLIYRDVIYLPKLDENPVGQEFLEHVRSTVEHEYNRTLTDGDSQQTKTNSNKTVVHDDIPF